MTDEEVQDYYVRAENIANGDIPSDGKIDSLMNLIAELLTYIEDTCRK